MTGGRIRYRVPRDRMSSVYTGSAEPNTAGDVQDSRITSAIILAIDEELYTTRLTGRSCGRQLTLTLA